MLLLDRLAFGVRHKGHISREFDSVSHFPLVFLAQAGSGRRLNLKLARNELTEYIRLLVINVIYFFLATNASHN